MSCVGGEFARAHHEAGGEFASGDFEFVGLVCHGKPFTVANRRMDSRATFGWRPEILMTGPSASDNSMFSRPGQVSVRFPASCWLDKGLRGFRTSRQLP